MKQFPNSVRLILVRDLYLHYDIGYHEDDGDVLVYCDHCDDVVSVFDWQAVEDMDGMELYEFLVDSHRDVEIRG